MTSYGRYHFHFPDQNSHVCKSASPKFGTWPPNKVFAGQDPATKHGLPCLDILEASRAQQQARGPRTRPSRMSASPSLGIRDMRLSQQRGPWAWRGAIEASCVSLQDRSCLVGGFWPASTLYGGQVPNFGLADLRTCKFWSGKMKMITTIRQAMMYLRTRGWSLAHISLAMTPQQSDTSEEYGCLESAGAGHSRSMCLSAPKAPVRQPTDTPVAACCTFQRLSVKILPNLALAPCTCNI